MYAYRVELLLGIDVNHIALPKLGASVPLFDMNRTILGGDIVIRKTRCHPIDAEELFASSSNVFLPICVEVGSSSGWREGIRLFRQSTLRPEIQDP